MLVLLGAIAQINPVWLIGPSQPGSISSGSVPDWYMAFLDGMLRIMPAWELSVDGHPLALGVLIAGLVMPALFFTCLALTFYGLLWAAAANDQITYHLHLDLYTVTWIFRVLVPAGPVLAFLLTRVICHALAGRRCDEERHGRETGRIAMNPQGGYTEIREPAHRVAPPNASPAGPASTRRGYVAAPSGPLPARFPGRAHCPAQTAARPINPGRRPDAMDRSSLVVAVMPIVTLIALFTGITLPFIAGRSHGRGALSRAAARKLTSAGQEGRPPKSGADDAAPVGYLYVPAPARATSATRPRRAAGSRRCPSSRRPQG